MVLIQEEENQILNNMKTKVVKITSDEIEFDNGIKLYSELMVDRLIYQIVK